MTLSNACRMATNAVCAVLTGWVVSGIGPASAQAGYSYVYTDLGALWSGTSEARAINDLGQIVGYVMAPQSAAQAVVWSDGAMSMLPSLAAGTAAYGINNAGEIVGQSGPRPVRWRNGLVSDLSPGNLSMFGSARDINDVGVVTGFMGVPNPFPTVFTLMTAVTWNTQGIQTDLPDETHMAVGSAINDKGQVAGYVGNYVNGNHNPARTRPATWSPALNEQPGLQYEAAAHDINNRGQVVGTIGYNTATPSPFPQAMMWHDGITTDLGPGIAYALNETTQIVGYSRFGTSQRAALWQNGTVLDLNTAFDPAAISSDWLLTSALDINESGFIVGVATQSGTGLRHAFLLSPVPEPAAIVLMLSGLAAIGLSQRTRLQSAGRQ